MNDPVDHGAAPQFLDLWPTQLMRIRLPGADAANPVLAGVIMAVSYTHLTLPTILRV